MSVGYLKSLVDVWQDQLEQARVKKDEDFGRTARLLWSFFTKSYRNIYVGDDEIVPDMSFANAEQQGQWYRPRVAKCREFVNVVLPFVHAKIPHRLVTPRDLPLPAGLMELAQATATMPGLPPEILALQGIAQSQPQSRMRDEIVAWLLQGYLNYIPDEYGAKREQRTAIQEALVKGRSVVWQSLTMGPSGLMPGSYYDSVDGLFIDPDCRQWRDAGYIFHEHHWPAWRLEDVFGIDADKIRSAATKTSGRIQRSGRTVSVNTADDSDDCVWFEVWSRIGMGEKLYKAHDTLRDQEQSRWDAIQEVSPNIYLAILPGLDAPLNLPLPLWQNGTTEEIANAIKWPIAFFEDKANPFPCVPLDIYQNTENPWATSPLEAGLVFQVYLDKIYAHLMNRVRTTSRDIILTAKILEEAVRGAILSGLDQVVVGVELEQLAEIEKYIHVLQFPDVKADAWKIIDLIGREFELATGMDPLIYGGQPSKQIRSSREAGIREAHVTNRPNDYADAVEEWNSLVAKAEGQMTRLYVRPQHVATLFREPVTENPQEFGPKTMLWASMVNTDDPAEAVSDLHYTVEAGSGRRKNKQNQLENFQIVAQTITPILQTFALNGAVQPWNAFTDLMEEVFEIPLGRLKVPMLPQPQQQGQQAGPEGEGIEQ